MAVDVLTEIVIERPLEVVAAFSADPDNAPKRYVNIKSVEWKTPRPAGVGSQMHLELPRVNLREKILPEPGKEQDDGGDTRPKKREEKDLSLLEKKIEKAPIGTAQPLEAFLETQLEAREEVSLLSKLVYQMGLGDSRL